MVILNLVQLTVKINHDCLCTYFQFHLQKWLVNTDNETP